MNILKLLLIIIDFNVMETKIKNTADLYPPDYVKPVPTPINPNNIVIVKRN